MDLIGSRYKRRRIPRSLLKVLLLNGCKPVVAAEWRRKKSVCFAILSVDPSGEKGEMENHLSISAANGETEPNQDSGKRGI